MNTTLSLVPTIKTRPSIVLGDNEKLIARLNSEPQNQKQIMEQLVKRNMGLVGNVLKRLGVTPMHADYHDYISEATLGLMRAAKEYDVSKNFQFTTFADTVMCRAVIQMHRSSHRRRNHMTKYAHRTPESQFVVPSHVDAVDPVQEITEILSKVSLDDRERRIVEMRYGINQGADFEPMTFREIAEEMGVTFQNIQQIHNKILAKMRAYMESK